MADHRIIAPAGVTARVAGGFYLVTVVASLYDHFVAGGSPLGQAARLVSGASYLTVVWLLYQLLRPAGRELALLAALFGVAGVARSENSVAYFGVYSFLVGYLTLRSTFLPKPLGMLMMLAGFGLLLTVYGPLLWPTMPRGVVALGFTLDAGEIVYALWLAIVGVNQERWRTQADSLPLVDRSAR